MESMLKSLYKPSMQCPQGFRELISEQEIHARLLDMARSLDELYQNTPFRFITLLDGALPFAHQLCELMCTQPDNYQVRASSYHGELCSSGQVDIQADWDVIPTDLPFIVLDDVLDTGRTLSALKSVLLQQGAPSVKFAVVINKLDTRVVPLEAEWSAFTLGPAFLIGFGMDLDGKFRNLPFIAEKIK